MRAQLPQDEGRALLDARSASDTGDAEAATRQRRGRDASVLITCCRMMLQLLSVAAGTPDVPHTLLRRVAKADLWAAFLHGALQCFLQGLKSLPAAALTPQGESKDNNAAFLF